MRRHVFGYSMNPRANRKIDESAKIIIEDNQINLEEPTPKIFDINVVNIPVFIITRTSNRPNYFTKCIESIQEQTYKNIINVVTVESPKDEKYVKKITKFSSQKPIICKVTKEDKEDTTIMIDGIKFYHAPYNKYVNEANSKIINYCKENGIVDYVVTLMDDDDCYTEKTAIEKIVTKFFEDFKFLNGCMVKWQEKLKTKTIPALHELESRPRLYNIGSNSFAYSGDLIDQSIWDEWSCSDFRSARNIFDHAKVIKSISKVLTTIQRDDCDGGRGIKDDLPIKTQKVTLEIEDIDKIDIIIPNYTTDQSLQINLDCLISIRKHLKNYRLIFVDNNGPLRNEIKNELKNHEDVFLIENTENLGFIKAVNQGIATATADYIFLLNNDTALTHRSVHKLLETLKKEENVMAIGCLCNTNGSWQNVDNARRGLELDIKPYEGTHDEYAEYLDSTIPGVYKIRKSGMIAFFATLFKRDVIKKVGYLNEEYNIGLCDDDDYCLRILKAGYHLAVRCDTLIFHNHRTTFKQLFSEEELKEYQTKNTEYFHKNK